MKIHEISIQKSTKNFSEDKYGNYIAGSHGEKPYESNI